MLGRSDYATKKQIGVVNPCLLGMLKSCEAEQFLAAVSDAENLCCGAIPTNKLGFHMTK